MIKQYFPEDIFKTIYKDITTRTHITADALETLNDWYCNEIVNQSIHDPTSLEGIAAFKNYDYIDVQNINNLVDPLDFFWTENNKNFLINKNGFNF